MAQLSEVCAKPLPFALRSYRDADADAQPVADDLSSGSEEAGWTWKPFNGISSDQLKIYASGGSSTSRQTWQGRWDHGEFE